DGLALTCDLDFDCSDATVLLKCPSRISARGFRGIMAAHDTLPARAADDGAVAEGSIGSRIRTFRKMRGLTLKSVATNAGVSESFLSQVERGSSGASVSTLKLIAEALGLSLADLFSDTDTPHHRVLRPEDRPKILANGVVKYMLTQRPLRELEVLE